MSCNCNCTNCYECNPGYNFGDYYGLIAERGATHEQNDQAIEMLEQKLIEYGSNILEMHSDEKDYFLRKIIVDMIYDNL